MQAEDLQNKHSRAQLEALVFSEGGEILVKTVLSTLGIQQDGLVQLVQEYNKSKRGTVLIIDDTKVLLRVASEHAGLVEQLRTDVQSTEISSAGLEVLAIVLYSDKKSGSMSASEVEHIRGVNSGYTLRQLTLRGLLSKSKSATGYQYAPTAELLGFLGVTDKSILPSRARVQQHLKEYYNNKDNAES